MFGIFQLVWLAENPGRTCGFGLVLGGGFILQGNLGPPSAREGGNDLAVPCIRPSFSCHASVTTRDSLDATPRAGRPLSLSARDMHGRAFRAALEAFLKSIGAARRSRFCWGCFFLLPFTIYLEVYAARGGGWMDGFLPRGFAQFFS